MNRLLEGDVGSGKTVVAAMAALNAAKAGYQMAFMAPTEILAKQHFKTIKEVLKKFKVENRPVNRQRKLFGRPENKKKRIAGKSQKWPSRYFNRHSRHNPRHNSQNPEKTPVQFNNLALVIIDEQHRFGVEQRAKLCRQTRFHSSLLSMTATPIPRTLSLTIYGDLDLSVIDELPKGRKKIITKIIQPKHKKATYEFIRQQVKEGRQAFVICPRIEPAKLRQAKF